MRGYAVQGPAESGTSNKTAVNVIASTSVRPRIFDIIVGCSGTPADQAANYVVGRTTAVGTAASNPTPTKIDDGDVAAVATAGITHSAEPTYASTFLLTIPINQRATFRWVASPGYELVATASANNGIGTKLSTSTSALVMTATVHWFE